MKMPQKNPEAFITQFKSGKNGGREVQMQVGPLDGLNDVYLLVVKESEDIESEVF
jgi:hypothetical protein